MLRKFLSLYWLLLYIQEMDKIMKTLDTIGIKLFVGCTERILLVSIFHYSFVCLRCVVTVSVHYSCVE